MLINFQAVGLLCQTAGVTECCISIIINSAFRCKFIFLTLYCNRNIRRPAVIFYIKRNKKKAVILFAFRQGKGNFLCLI